MDGQNPMWDVLRALRGCFQCLAASHVFHAAKLPGGLLFSSTPCSLTLNAEQASRNHGMKPFLP
eukprot:150526-Pelagomonas_calceolata.AAC.1